MAFQASKEAVEIVGVIAIVLSLILVAYELRQNTLTMRARINQSRTEVAVSEQQVTYNSDHIPDLVVRLDSGEPLTNQEMLRYGTYLRAFLGNQDNAYWQFRKGLRDEKIPRSIRHGVRDVIGSRNIGIALWDRPKSTYTDEFAGFVDEAIADLRE